MRTQILPLALLAACGGGKPTLVLDEAVVAEKLTFLTTAIPTCTTTTDAASTARRAITAAQGEIDALRRVTGTDGPRQAGTSTTGFCGGSMDVTSEHADGVTDYIATFTDFCLDGEAADQVWNGTLHGKEIGTPSPDGPVIKAFELETTTPLTIQTGGDTATATITGARGDYGDPAPWYPGAPTEAKPNVVQVDTIEVDFAGGDAYTLTGLRYETVGAFITSTVHVTDGMLEGPDGTVTVRTDPDAPLGVTLANGSVSTGGLILGGAKDTTVELTPNGETFGVVGIVVNGAPYAEDLDCSGAVGPTAQLLTGILSAFPIY